jgi:hypothetical protein
MFSILALSNVLMEKCNAGTKSHADQAVLRFKLAITMTSVTKPWTCPPTLRLPLGLCCMLMHS